MRGRNAGIISPLGGEEAMNLTRSGLLQTMRFPPISLLLEAAQGSAGRVWLQSCPPKSSRAIPADSREASVLAIGRYGRL